MPQLPLSLLHHPGALFNGSIEHSLLSPLDSVNTVLCKCTPQRLPLFLDVVPMRSLLLHATLLLLLCNFSRGLHAHESDSEASGSDVVHCHGVGVVGDEAAVDEFLVLDWDVGVVFVGEEEFQVEEVVDWTDEERMFGLEPVVVYLDG